MSDFCITHLQYLKNFDEKDKGKSRSQSGKEPTGNGRLQTESRGIAPVRFAQKK